MNSHTQTILVGQDIDAWCTRCRHDTIHVVVSMVLAHVPKRVECKSCGGQHNFRPPSYLKAASQARAKSPPSIHPSQKNRQSKSQPSQSSASSSKEANWAKHIQQTDATKVRLYSPRDQFSAGEVIEHSQFGQGFILDVITGSKLIVLFREGKKTLISGVGVSQSS